MGVSRRVERRDAVVGNCGARERRVDVLMERSGWLAVMFVGGWKRFGCLDSTQVRRHGSDLGEAVVKECGSKKRMGLLTEGKQFADWCRAGG